MAVKKPAPQDTSEKDEFDFAPAWQPAEGDIIRGKIVTLDSGYSEYGNYPIVTVETEADGQYAVHAFHEALRNKLADLKPEVGHEIAIKYFGEVASKSSKFSYHKYVVKTEGTPQGFWDNQQAPSAAAEDDEDIPF